MTDPNRRAFPVQEITGESLDFGRALMTARKLQRAIEALRSDLDGEIARSGAARRVRERSLARVRPIAGIAWHTIAAAMLVAAMLGGMLDLVLPAQEPEPGDVAVLDPVLYGLDATELQ